MFTIYIRTNTVNGKQYVGQTKDLKRREKDWKKLCKSYANKHIDEDRLKYGFDKWKVEKLEECNTQEEAWKLESEYIKKYNTKYPNGYNMSDGGAGGFTGILHSEETKKKMSISQRKENHPNWQKRLSEETKKKISSTLIEKCGKKVYQYTLDGELVKIWNSASEVRREIGYNNKHISDCCNGIRNKHKGYKWSYRPL